MANQTVTGEEKSVTLNARVRLVRTDRGYLLQVETATGDRYETPISYQLAHEMREDGDFPRVLRS